MGSNSQALQIGQFDGAAADGRLQGIEQLTKGGWVIVQQRAQRNSGVCGRDVAGATAVRVGARWWVSRLVWQRNFSN